uniref:Undecaprenyl-phosphate galactosephosphotransferase n=1 Tax=uncultured bacterium Contigcl_1787 TaxID=1393662 RepID=W0FMS4_9BACT|nr:undecaprenyl-phosphate galactosephosphotransferase [uncultured bacterium Contigcl_1787]
MIGFIPLLLIVAPLIWIDDPGPVFYNASRLGYKGKVFKMYKFRSMKVNAPDIRNADGSTFNGDNDPRVTKVGRILRKTSLDEVPQFLNVLKGDMSLIGPRAHLTTHYTGLKDLTKEQRHRLKVKPGITGYNQAYFRNSVSADEKIKNDNYYVDNLSLGLDLKIFFATIDSVLKRKNIYVDSTTKDGVKG